MTSNLYTDFMCSCGLIGSAQCQRVLYAAKKQLRATDADLLTRVVYGLECSLGGGYSGFITGMVADQWARVDAKVYRLDFSGERVLHTEISVQCDRLEYGLARVWQLARGSCDTTELVHDGWASGPVD